MTLFWILTAVMIAAALAIIAPALLRRQRTDVLDRNAQNVAIAKERLAELDAELAKGELRAEQHTSAKLELEQVLLQDIDAGGAAQTTAVAEGYGKISLLVLVLAVPLLSIFLYQALGTPALITAETRAPVSSGHGNEVSAGSMTELALKLHQRLEKETPDDANGWFLLGRTYMNIRDYPQAAQAFDRALQLLGEQPGIMLALADALTMSQQGNTSGRPAELVQKALAMEPENTTALWMAALAAEDRGDDREALRLMQQLHPLLVGEPQEQQQLSAQIARLSAKAGIAAPTLSNRPATPSADPTEPANVVRLKVSLSPALQQKTRAEDTVFIYAKAVNGPRFPVAAARYRVSDLPMEITLDDSLAVMTEAKLSDFPRVNVGARVSSSGNAITQSGDLIGERQNIQVGDESVVEIVIDSVHQP